MLHGFGKPYGACGQVGVEWIVIVIGIAMGLDGGEIATVHAPSQLDTTREVWTGQAEGERLAISISELS